MPIVDSDRRLMIADRNLKLRSAIRQSSIDDHQSSIRLSGILRPFTAVYRRVKAGGRPRLCCKEPTAEYPANGSFFVPPTHAACPPPLAERAPADCTVLLAKKENMVKPHG